MSLPYRIVLIVAILTGVAFVAGPWWTLRQITAASKQDDGEAWRRLVNVEDIRAYTGGFLNALLESKLQLDMQKSPGEALQAYFEGKGLVEAMSERSIRPEALQQLVCGEVLGDVKKPAELEGCWALKGDMQWQSPLLVKVTFTHPQHRWQSKLLLLRTGMFTWKLDSIELPVQAILERMAVLAENEAV